MVVKFDGVDFYYSVHSPLTNQDLDQLRILPLSQELHLLRHFTTFPEGFVASVLGQKVLTWSQVEKKMVPVIITQELLDDSLKTKGSKFLSEAEDGYIKNPTHLSELIVEYLSNGLSNRVAFNNFFAPYFNMMRPLIWYSSQSGKKILKLKITYPRNIGTSSVVKISDLTAEQQVTVRKEFRGKGLDAYEVQTVLLQKPPLSSDLVVTLIKNSTEENAFIATAYSGIVVPPLPDWSMVEPLTEEEEYNRKYWKDLAFVISS